jgi:ABC-type transport system involved in multi-copper enzyme maturation permease subunit
MTVSKIWQDLVAGNPMLIEIQRFRRRFLTFSGSNTMNSAVLALAMICYAGLVLVVLQAKGEMSPLLIVMFQTGLFTIFAPGMLHGAIAGERERRSWDLLLVAPISKAQIVVGKYIGALAAMATASVFLLVPTLLAGVTYRHTIWIDVIEAEAVSLSFTTAVCAFTILISARVKRPFMALGASLGTLAVALLVVPGLISAMVGAYHGFDEDILFLHPFVVLEKIMSISEANAVPTGRDSSSFIGNSNWGWIQVFVYLAMAVVFVTWAAKTLIFAENEVKFIPRAHVDA